MKLGILKGTLRVTLEQIQQKEQAEKTAKKGRWDWDLMVKQNDFFMYYKFPLILWCNAENYFLRIFEAYTYLTIDTLRED